MISSPPSGRARRLRVDGGRTIMFGRRTPVVAATKSELLVATPNSTFWEYDEQVLRLTNSALDAELSLSDTALASDDWDHLPAVEAICRAGNVACSFTIRRRQVEFASEREGDDAQYMTWWCLDYGDAIARGSG